MTVVVGAADGTEQPDEEPVDEGQVEHGVGGLWFWLGLAVGGIVMAIGLRGIWIHRIDTRPRLGAHDLISFVVGGAIIHDLLLAPVALLIGVAVAKAAPAVVRPFVQGGLFASALVTAISLPVVRGYGRNPTNGTLLPRNYATGLVKVLIVIWVLAAAAAAISIVRRRSLGPADVDDTTA